MRILSPPVVFFLVTQTTLDERPPEFAGAFYLYVHAGLRYFSAASRSVSLTGIVVAGTSAPQDLLSASFSASALILRLRRNSVWLLPPL